MAKPSFSDIEKLLQGLVLPFYEIIRDISVPTHRRRHENDAEHSWALAFMASALAPQIDPKLDVGKVCMFAIVHDVVEIHAGDTSVWSHQKHLDSKQTREVKAIAKIDKEYAAFPWIAETIKSYERKDSNEAKFVYSLDKFLNLLLTYVDKNVHNIENHQLTKQRFDEFIVSHRSKAHSHKAVGKYYDDLLEAFDAHPEYFYHK
ncbi:hypothetical protein A3D14_02130 [Candidatus Saccharibacteria bacterium RIFCSPHIGHO2_02_FULL_47_12]|nr:MAG: hypothetical protein A3D14_02130 [Candidatus Saccharibacteria bacterium RIFCSPHIGHO2_02_FULL_47_12]